MTITAAIDQILDAADKCGVLATGLEIGVYTAQTDEQRSLPFCLVDTASTEISDDAELASLRAHLRRLGWSTETTDTGISLVALA